MLWNLTRQLKRWQWKIRCLLFKSCSRLLEHLMGSSSFYFKTFPPYFSLLLYCRCCLHWNWSFVVFILSFPFFPSVVNFLTLTLPLGKTSGCHWERTLEVQLSDWSADGGVSCWSWCLWLGLSVGNGCMAPRAKTLLHDYGTNTLSASVATET